jgi:hypothetical protein
MRLSDFAQILDQLSKIDPDKIGEIVMQQMAPGMHMLSGISKSLDELNANLKRLIELEEKRERDAGNSD